MEREEKKLFLTDFRGVTCRETSVPYSTSRRVYSAKDRRCILFETPGDLFIRTELTPRRRSPPEPGSTPLTQRYEHRHSSYALHKHLTHTRLQPSINKPWHPKHGSNLVTYDHELITYLVKIAAVSQIGRDLTFAATAAQLKLLSGDRTAVPGTMVAVRELLYSWSRSDVSPTAIRTA